MYRAVIMKIFICLTMLEKTNENRGKEKNKQYEQRLSKR